MRARDRHRVEATIKARVRVEVYTRVRVVRIRVYGL
jgi:hypothetical protein